jgi:hypothetical protein
MPEPEFVHSNALTRDFDTKEAAAEGGPLPLE